MKIKRWLLAAILTEHREYLPTGAINIGLHLARRNRRLHHTLHNVEEQLQMKRLRAIVNPKVRASVQRRYHQQGQQQVCHSWLNIKNARHQCAFAILNDAVCDGGGGSLIYDILDLWYPRGEKGVRALGERGWG